MKKFLLHALATIAFVSFSSLAVASSVAEMFSCELEDGKTVEDAHAANSKWLKWVNENAGHGKITSSIATAIVGNTEGFLWIDTYPDLDTWSATKNALETKEGKAVEGVFEGITKCKKNRLWRINATK